MHLGKYMLISLIILVGGFALTEHHAHGKEPVYQVGIFDTAPYNYVGEGTFHQNLKDLFEASGLTVNLRFVPFKRGLNAVKAGDLHMMVPVTRTPEREEKLVYVGKPMIRLPFLLIKRADNDFEWQGDMNSLIGKRIGYYRGAKLSSRLEEMMKQGLVEKVNVNDVQQMLLLVQSGRIDLALTSQFTFQTGMNELNLRHELVALQPALKTLDLHLVISKEVPHARKLSQTLLQSKENKEAFRAW